MLLTPGCLAGCRRPAARRERSLKYPTEPALSSASSLHRLTLRAAPSITLSLLCSAERPPAAVTCCAGSATTVNKTPWMCNRDAAVPQGMPPCSEGSSSYVFLEYQEKVFFFKMSPHIRVSFPVAILGGSGININDRRFVFDPWLTCDFPEVLAIPSPGATAAWPVT